MNPYESPQHSPGKPRKPPLPARIMVPSCVGSLLFLAVSVVCFIGLLASAIEGGIAEHYSEPNYPGNGPAVYDPPHPVLEPGFYGALAISLAILAVGLGAAYRARARDAEATPAYFYEIKGLAQSVLIRGLPGTLETIAIGCLQRWAGLYGRARVAWVRDLETLAQQNLDRAWAALERGETRAELLPMPFTEVPPDAESEEEYFVGGNWSLWVECLTSFEEGDRPALTFVMLHTIDLIEAFLVDHAEPGPTVNEAIESAQAHPLMMREVTRLLEQLREANPPDGPEPGFVARVRAASVGVDLFGGRWFDESVG